MLAQLSVTALLVLCCFPETEVLQGRFNFTYRKARENLDLDMTRFLCPLSSSVFQLSLPSPFHKRPCGAGAEALKTAGRCSVGLRLGALEGACGLWSQRHRPSPTSSPGRAVFPPKRLKSGCSFSKTCRTSLNAPPPPRSVSQPLGTPPLGLETLAPAVHLLLPGAEFQLCRPFFKGAMFPGSSHSPRPLGAWPFLHLPLHHHLGSGPTLPALPYLVYILFPLFKQLVWFLSPGWIPTDRIPNLPSSSLILFTDNNMIRYFGPT